MRCLFLVKGGGIEERSPFWLGLSLQPGDENDWFLRFVGGYIVFENPNLAGLHSHCVILSKYESYSKVTRSHASYSVYFLILYPFFPHPMILFRRLLFFLYLFQFLSLENFTLKNGVVLLTPNCLADWIS